MDELVTHSSRPSSSCSEENQQHQDVNNILEEEEDNEYTSDEFDQIIITKPESCSNEDLVCKLCQKVFDNLHRLQRHMLSHDMSPELRKFKCEFCNKAFKFKHHLKVLSLCCSKAQCLVSLSCISLCLYIYIFTLKSHVPYVANEMRDF